MTREASADEVAERMSAGITDNLAAILGWLLDAPSRFYPASPDLG